MRGILMTDLQILATAWIVEARQRRPMKKAKRPSARFVQGGGGKIWKRIVEKAATGRSKKPSRPDSKMKPFG
jgi:hypothetical protein